MHQFFYCNYITYSIISMLQEFILVYWHLLLHSKISIKYGFSSSISCHEKVRVPSTLSQLLNNKYLWGMSQRSFLYKFFNVAISMWKQKIWYVVITFIVVRNFRTIFWNVHYRSWEYYMLILFLMIWKFFRVIIYSINSIYYF